MWQWRQQALLDTSALLTDVITQQLSAWAAPQANSTSTAGKPLLLAAIEAALSSPESLTGELD